MKKIILVVLSLILLLSGCSPKPMTEEKMIDILQDVFESYKRQKAVAVLKENEAIIGTSEFMTVSGTHERVVSNADYVVSFRTIDRTYYYAFYSNQLESSVGAVLMRVRKGYMLTGDVIWNRKDQDAVMSLINYNEKMCYVFLEHRNGKLEYDRSFSLERNIGGEWEVFAEIQGDTPTIYTRGKTGTDELSWEANCGSLYPGTYKITVPVHCTLFDDKHKPYDKDIELSAEFIIEPQ